MHEDTVAIHCQSILFKGLTEKRYLGFQKEEVEILNLGVCGILEMEAVGELRSVGSL